ncbi:hypothetical protein [Kineosporia mesophila]|uniref:hypothetical protein n=1 Tax=Kineosporia mesophila TaxID=566012 RepID=UPI001E5590A2|nr:hypothetical protein [Kineosporia mesophila]
MAATGAVSDAEEVCAPEGAARLPEKATAGCTAIGAVAGTAASAPVVVRFAAWEDIPIVATSPPDMAITAPPRPSTDIWPVTV